MKFNKNYVLFLRTCYLSANIVCSFHIIFNLKIHLKFANKFTVVMILYMLSHTCNYYPFHLLLDNTPMIPLLKTAKGDISAVLT